MSKRQLSIQIIGVKAIRSFIINTLYGELLQTKQTYEIMLTEDRLIISYASNKESSQLGFLSFFIINKCNQLININVNVKKVSEIKIERIKKPSKTTDAISKDKGKESESETTESKGTSVETSEATDVENESAESDDNRIKMDK